MYSYEASRSGLASDVSSYADGRVSRKAEIPLVHRVVTHLARRLNQVCLGVSAEVTLPEGLTPQEYAVVASVDEEPGLDQRALAMRLAIDPMTATQHLDKLEGMRLVTRSAHASDRRVRLLHITDDGRRLRRRLRPRLEAVHSRILAPLTNDERAVFLEMLVRVVEGNNAYAKPGLARRRPVRSRS
jgi:DNA-binding MarR family transcriptional regulator